MGENPVQWQYGILLQTNGKTTYRAVAGYASVPSDKSVYPYPIFSPCLAADWVLSY